MDKLMNQNIGSLQLHFALSQLASIKPPKPILFYKVLLDWILSNHTMSLAEHISHAFLPHFCRLLVTQAPDMS